MRLPLWIFTEGDRQRGLGHLTRCLAYAAAWHMQGGEVHWVVDGDEAARIVLQGQTVSWRVWQHQPWDTSCAAVAIVDSYSTSLEVLQSISRHFRRAVFLDDTERLPYPKGLVVHAAPGEGKPMPGEAEWVRGPAWQPLRPAFWTVPQRSAVSASVERVLILMGGSDLRGLVPRMVAITRGIFPSAEIHAVLGNTLATMPEDCIAHRQLDAQAMCELMQAADVAVSAAGQATYELARCGVPGVLIGVADNQDKQLREWPLTGAFVSAGWWNDVAIEEKVAAGLRQLASGAARKAAAQAGQSCVDGQGITRVLAWLTRGEV